MKFDIKQGNVKNIKPDDWNELEIIVAGNRMEFKKNGESLRTVKAKSDSPPLGVRAEFGAAEFRHMRFNARR